VSGFITRRSNTVCGTLLGACQVGSGAFGECFWFLYMVVRRVTPTTDVLPHIRYRHHPKTDTPLCYFSNYGRLSYLPISKAARQISQTRRRQMINLPVNVKKNSASVAKRAIFVFVCRLVNSENHTFKINITSLLIQYDPRNVNP